MPGNDNQEENFIYVHYVHSNSDLSLLFKQFRRDWADLHADMFLRSVVCFSFQGHKGWSINSVAYVDVISGNGTVGNKAIVDDME